MMMNESNEVHEDYSCPICLTAFYLPVQIAQCKHTFCEPCIEVNVMLSGKRKCPLCRAQYTSQEIIRADKLWEEVQKNYPHIIEEKKKHIKTKKMFHLSVGNSTRVIQTNEDNKYEWTMFVRSAPGEKPLKEYAEKIEIKLHETFRPNTIIYDMKNLNSVELKRLGWGTFRIYVKIFWKNIFEEKETEIHHDLEFDPLVEKEIGCLLHEKKSFNA